MAKYEFDLSVGIKEVLDADSAKKVESQIEAQKKKFEEPIELTLNISDAQKRFKELEKEAKKVQKSLDKALSAKNFDGISKYTKQMSNIQKEQNELLSIIGEQTKVITQQTDAIKTVEAAEKRRKKTVDNITAATEDTVAAIKEQAEAINQVAKAEAKLKRTRKSKSSTKKDTKIIDDVTQVTEQTAKSQENVAKTKLRTQSQVNAELDKELQKLKEIEAQQAKNDAARERFKKKQSNYGKEVLGVGHVVYDTDLLKGAPKELDEFNELLKTRNKYQEKYNQLCRMVENRYTTNYGVSQGMYKDLDEFVEFNKSMKELDVLFESGQKTTNKHINELFSDVVKTLRSEINSATRMLSSGNASGDMVGQNLDREETELNKEMQKLGEAREAQLKKINTLRQEEIDLIKQAGQEEAKVVAIQGKKTLNMESVIKRYNKLMNTIGKEHRTIGTVFSQGTENFNIADMVNEAEYWLDAFKNEGPGSNDSDEVKIWKSELGKLSRFIETYKSLTEGIKPNGIVAKIDIVDEEELEIIKKENGALEDKLELLQEIAEQYGSDVNQRKRNRFEELNQKDMDGGLTSSQEERYWELGEAIDEADRQLDEFGQTYERVILKLGNGRKIEILPDDAGLNKFNKIATEYFQGEYNGIEIEDVIFERAKNTTDALLEEKDVIEQVAESQNKLKKLNNTDDSQTLTLQRTIELLGQLDTIQTQPLHYLVQNVMKDSSRIQQEVKDVLQALHLLDSEGNFIGRFSDQGMSSKGVTMNDRYAIISRRGDAYDNFDDKEYYDFGFKSGTYLENLILKMAEAKSKGVELARILTTVESKSKYNDKVLYEIQELASGQQAHIIGSGKTLQNFEAECARIVQATDEQILKLMSDVVELNNMGFKLDFGPGNVLYDTANGFSLIDVALRELDEDVPTTEKLMQRLFSCLMGFSDNDYRLSERFSDFGSEDNTKWINAMDSVAQRLNAAFENSVFKNDLSQSSLLTSEIDAYYKTITDKSDTLEHLVNSLNKLDSINPNPLNKIIESIVNGEEKISSEVREILNDLNLLNDAGKFSGNFITEGMNNSGVVTNDKYAIIARGQEVYNQYDDYEFDFKDNTTYIDNLIAKEKEAVTQGVNLARVLDVVKSKSISGGDLFYEIQEFAPGEQLHVVDAQKKTLQGFEQECQRIVSVTDEQIQKLMSDIIKLNELGFFIDFNPANILYDATEGFKLIDLELRDLGSSAQTTTELMEGLFVCLTGFEYNIDNINSGMKDADRWGTSMASVYERLNKVFTQNNFGVNVGDITSTFNDDFRKYIVQTKKEQTEVISNAVEQTEAQVKAEEKLAEATEKTANAKKKQPGTKNTSDIAAEEIIKRDIDKALEQLRSAKHNETTLFTLKGVFDGDDLVSQAEAMVKNIAELSNLNLGKFTVKDDIIKVQLYNEELKVIVDQMYRLKAATEEMESAQLQLTSQSFSQNVKALNANNFDAEGVQQRALAAIEKVRSSLHGLEYDLTDLENAAKTISSQDDFTKFNNQLKAAQDNIQAIKNSTVSKSSMNPLANMQRDMQNANIEIETMRLKLEKFGDIQGVAEAKQMLTDMAEAAKQYNSATDAQGQQAAYNQYSNLRSSFKAQTEYINAAKSLNDSQKSEEKKIDPIRQQYQSILDLVEKINKANERMIKFQSMDGGSGVLGKQIQTEVDKKAVAIEKLNAVMSELNVGNILGKDQYTVSDDIQSIGTDYSKISAFINDAGVQASLTTAEIEKLTNALTKAGDIDLSMLNTMLDSTSIKERAKQTAYENKYFADKTTVTPELDINGINKLGDASVTTKEKLESMAQAIAQNSEGAVALTKNFSMGADGIARLDFSVFDRSTNSMRNFTMELGTATGQIATYETTISKSMANMKAAEKQMSSMGDLIGRLSLIGTSTDGGSNTPQVQRLLEVYQLLSAELAKGNNADQTVISKLIKDSKMASSEVEKLYKQMLQMESAIASGQAKDLGVGNPKGDVYAQLVNATKEIVGANQNTTIEFGRFDAATNTLNASLIHANGTVENFKVQMSGLSGQMSAQETGVTRLTSSWDKFKASMGQAGKHLMTALVGYNAFFKVVSEVRKGIGYVKEIDLALTELKKVTDETEESYKKFLNTAAGTAGEIGSTVSDFTEASANFARLGYTMEESAEMAKTAIVYKNVADGLDTVEESTDSIISTMKAFGIESNDTMGIVDRFNEVKLTCLPVW